MKIEQKWGFGMAPVKAALQAERMRAVQELAELLSRPSLELTDTVLPEQISMTKGLFTRCWKQDQWDWFTVWQQLGRPGRKRAWEATGLFRDLRSSLMRRDFNQLLEFRLLAYDLDIPGHLRRFLTSSDQYPSDVGYIYVLSTREQPTVLKVGYTNRTVEERVKEINSSTGVVIPYGVRAIWAVSAAREVEADLHRILSDYRIRRDREFFELDFKDAFRLIRDYVYAKRAEL